MIVIDKICDHITACNLHEAANMTKKAIMERHCANWEYRSNQVDQINRQIIICKVSREKAISALRMFPSSTSEELKNAQRDIEQLFATYIEELRRKKTAIEIGFSTLIR
jgi:hypothetical protein